MPQKSVTKSELRTQAKENGFNAVSKDAFAPIFNPGDAELTYALFHSAVAIAQLSGVVTLMRKHTQAAFDSYKLLYEQLGREDEKITQKSMREAALAADGVDKVSQKAIKTVYNKADPVLTIAKWNTAIALAQNKELKNSKTLMPAHADAANAVYGHLRALLEEEEEGEGGENDNDDDAPENDMEVGDD